MGSLQGSHAATHNAKQPGILSLKKAAAQPMGCTACLAWLLGCTACAAWLLGCTGAKHSSWLAHQLCRGGMRAVREAGDAARQLQLQQGRLAALLPSPHCEPPVGVTKDGAAA
jgi:hypothetical protein